jgi:hypothetical protein
MTRASLLLTLALLCGACGGLPQRSDVLNADAGIAANDAELIVVTVINDSPAGAPRAGSSPRSYNGPAQYSASSAAKSLLRDIANEYSMTEVTAWPIAPLGVHCGVFRLAPGTERTALLSRLSQDARVQLAQPMNTFASRSSDARSTDARSSEYNDPYMNLQRGFQSIDAGGAQQWSRGERVRVAIVDTGIDTTHPDLGGRVVVRRNFVDRDAQQFDRDRHGTAIAGVISASPNNRIGIAGIAPSVELLALKACWQINAASDAARCNSLTLAQALVAAMEERAQIVNLSLTGPPDPLLNALVAAGTEKGVLFVGAAPGDADPAGFPGGARTIIAVDAMESGSARTGVLRAPGRDVVTLQPGGRYDFISGSSLATAHVTGAVALLVARARGLDRTRAFDLLQKSESAGRDAADAGAINVCAALASLIGQAKCDRD